MDILASIPSPGTSEINLGPFPLRGYAVCIIIGVFVAIWYGGRRWVARGGRPGTVADVAIWAVPFGLIGARIYHVATDYQLYFGEGKDPVDAFKIWDGGIGIWGAIAGGAFGAWIVCKRRGIPLPAFADAVAPGIALAQAIGRWGNWFNQELYGRATDVPWALEIDNGRDEGTFHPTFLYESLWSIGVALLVIFADRRWKLGHGRAFALYVAAYTAGRFWVEYLRIDEAHEVLGLRLNNWTSLLVFAAAVAYIVISARRRPGREDPATIEPLPADAGDGAAAGGDEDDGEAEVDAGTDAGADSDAEEPEQAEKAGGKAPAAEGAAEGESGEGDEGDEDGGAERAGKRSAAESR
ncbi:prolipoprotein diacylglyceryl transferase [Streptomyces aidingensis]|uniref:Phosphatidylglycerol--prolipoprotein diacylglyceryl transferase n=1 Tax=Streptomyces aidingensis TaxID=910347 RepID=A0A1I1ME66_9ACTN|nr:prolipoprotein diacylglyceryl transferase [Streptomyces aidingensis]SFC83694.1 prolipoprotein diacylglyceryl transferase [Streptomyces aidingensis]